MTRVLKNKLNILAYIPARGGSKRLLNKNILKIGGKPLIAHPIELAKRIPYINKIVVDTDSTKIASIAKKYGAEIPFLRPKHLGSSAAQITDSIIFTLKRLSLNFGYKPDIVLLLQPTSPIRNNLDIKNALGMLGNKCDAVVSVCENEPLLFNLEKNGTLKLANKYTIKSSNSQDWPRGYILNGNIFAIKTSTLYSERTFLPNRTKALILPKWRSIDINDIHDLVLARVLYKNKGALQKADKI